MMDITLTGLAIQLRLKHDCVNLKPLIYFVQNSFSDVKHYSNMTVVKGSKEESVKLRYILKWAYKIYMKSPNRSDDINFKKLSDAIERPIYILSENSNHISQTLTMTVEHLGDNLLSISSNQYNSQVIKYFKSIFKDSMSRSSERRIFTITIHTKKDLLTLQKILSAKSICNTRVSFITQSLNFKKLNKDRFEEEENAFKEKLQKCYKVLSIDQNSSLDEIKKNYRQMLKKYHPDRVYSQDNETVELYTRRFQVIQKAYELVQEHHKVA
jgi:hypothetical protein